MDSPPPDRERRRSAIARCSTCSASMALAVAEPGDLVVVFQSGAYGRSASPVRLPVASGLCRSAGLTGTGPEYAEAAAVTRSRPMSQSCPPPPLPAPALPGPLPALAGWRWRPSPPSALPRIPCSRGRWRCSRSPAACSAPGDRCWHWRCCPALLPVTGLAPWSVRLLVEGIRPAAARLKPPARAARRQRCGPAAGAGRLGAAAC